MGIENQPVWQTIQLLNNQSRGTRTPTLSPECQLEVNGERYFIRAIRDNSHGDISEIHQLLRANFNPKEVEPEEELIDKLEKKVPDKGNYQHLALAIKDFSQCLVGVFMGAQLNLVEQNGQSTGETMLFRGYTTVKPAFRRYGFARELYLSALIASADEAEKQGITLTLAMSEAVSSAEAAWNKLGLRRIYAQVNGTNIYEELPYFQPPHKFDPRSGEVAEEAGIVPEHLMIHNFGLATLNCERVMQALRAAYRKVYINPQRDFQSQEAYFRHRQYVLQKEADFAKFLFAHGQLIFLTAEDREKIRTQGTVIHEFSDADFNYGSD